VERHVARFEELGDDAGLAEGLSLVGMIRFWQGKAATSEQVFERALGHARQADDRRQEGEILKRLALAIDVGPTPAEEGSRRLDTIIAQSHGDRRVEIGAARARAALEAMRGRFDEARRSVERGKALARELGDRVALAAIHRDAGLVEMRAGDPVAHEREARAGYEILRQIGDTGHLASAAPDLAEAVYAQGHYDEALELAEFAREITIQGDVDAEVRGLQVLAKATARLGRQDQAEALAADAVRLISATDYHELHAFTLVSQAEVLSLGGRTREAASAAREAAELFRKKGNAVNEARAAAFLDDLET
jgi:tetratricopeptide (TPR) repeat protein